MSVDVKEVVQIAKEAGQAILRLYGKEGISYEKEDKSLVTDADFASQSVIADRLRKYNYAVLSEEEKDSKARLPQEYAWIVDPLDGTNDFLANTGEFTVMMGLARAGKPVLGVVHQPATGTTYFAEKGEGAFVEDATGTRQIQVSLEDELEKARFLVSKTHFTEDIRLFLEKHRISNVIRMGSSGLKLCKIAEGQAEAHITFTNRTFEWDVCAADIILTEAGGRVTDTRGKNFIYNKEDPRNSYGVVAGNPVFHAQLLELVQQ